MQFIDLKAQQRQLLPDGRSLRQAVDARLAALLDHGQYILGPDYRSACSQCDGSMCDGSCGIADIRDVEVEDDDTADTFVVEARRSDTTTRIRGRDEDF